MYYTRPVEPVICGNFILKDGQICVQGKVYVEQREQWPELQQHHTLVKRSAGPLGPSKH